MMVMRDEFGIEFPEAMVQVRRFGVIVDWDFRQRLMRIAAGDSVKSPYHPGGFRLLENYIEHDSLPQVKINQP